MRLSIKLFNILLASAFAASAHYAWLETESKTLSPGQSTKVKVGFGHEVGHSESAVNLDGLALWAISPSGQKMALKPIAADKWVVAEFTAKEGGVHRFVMTQDRGVMSQTTKGFKPGGRDVHPDAKKSMKMWRSAVTYAGAGDKIYASGLGLPFEVMAKRQGRSVELTVLRDGKPATGAEVALNVPGKEEADKIGVTDGAGKFSHTVAEKGPSLFLVTLSSPAPAGSNYDTETLTSVLVVQ